MPCTVSHHLHNFRPYVQAATLYVHAATLYVGHTKQCPSPTSSVHCAAVVRPWLSSYAELALADITLLE